MMLSVGDIVAIIGVIVAIVTLIVSIIFYINQKNKKSLTFDVLVNTKLVFVKNYIKDDVIIYYENEEEEVDNLYLLVLQLTNTGNLPIKYEDFDIDNPITFTFYPKGLRIITTQIAESYPTKLQVPYEVTVNQISLKQVLLNPGDYFAIRAIISSQKNYVHSSVNGRVIGLKEIKIGKNADSMTRGDTIAGISHVFGIISLSFVIYSVVWFFSSTLDLMLIIAFSFFLGILLLSILLIAVFWYKFFSERAEKKWFNK